MGSWICGSSSSEDKELVENTDDKSQFDANTPEYKGDQTTEEVVDSKEDVTIVLESPEINTNTEDRYARRTSGVLSQELHQLDSLSLSVSSDEDLSSLSICMDLEAVSSSGSLLRSTSCENKSSNPQSLSENEEQPELSRQFAVES